MNTYTLWNENWTFVKEAPGPGQTVDAPGQAVTLPHTWNAKDGQGGGNDYYRGTCWYVKRFPDPVLEKEGEAWLEFRGAAMTAEVWLNGQRLARHAGGYSTFRVNLTPALKVTPVVDLDRKAATVTVESFQNGGIVDFTLNGETKAIPSVDGRAKAEFVMDNVHLWDGVDDPYLYTVTACLSGGDVAAARFGCRSFRVDPEKGFMLNGRSYRLCGAARHQDREGLGSALTRKEHEEDMALLLEMGANTVRLAHYQHDQYFYDLCDEKGLIVWAEIPYITEHMPEARQNTIDQMTELVEQNYNHPSIICWGLSNEITVTGGVTEDLVENHRVLNELCHRLDPTRLTTMAHAFMLDPDDPFVMLPDIRSYNLYYGWYVGDWGENDRWFDDFHARHPDAAMGLSEYGADANPAYQSETPEKGDWSEGYQCLYHEHMIQMWLERPYIWAMHVWNMFDFGADGRDEGGKPGQNQKGLVAFDRKTKKDAFYLYKAYLSKHPFVHVCGGRYVDRVGEETEIKVYSNQSEVTLSVDDKLFQTQRGEKIFRFTIPLTGKHSVMAQAGDCRSVILIRKVDTPNPAYRKAGGEVVNWFDREDEIIKAGCFSILDPIGEVKAHPRAGAVLMELLEPLQVKVAAAYGDVAKNVRIPESMQKMMDRMSVRDTLKQMGSLVTPEFVHQLNTALHKVNK